MSKLSGKQARNYQTLISNMKELRLQAGMTQKELGKAVGKSKAAISRYERCKSAPKIDTLAHIAVALNSGIRLQPETTVIIKVPGQPDRTYTGIHILFSVSGDEDEKGLLNSDIFMCGQYDMLCRNLTGLAARLNDQFNEIMANKEKRGEPAEEK